MASIPLAVFGQVLESGKAFNIDVVQAVRLSSVALDESAKPGSSSVVKLKFLDMPAGEDDEDEDEEPDVDEKEIVLAHLVAGRAEYQALDLVLPEEQTFTFTVSGSNKVHLLGQYIDVAQAPAESDDDLSESEGGWYDPDTGLPVDSDEDMDDDEDEDEVVDSGRFQEIKEETTKPVKPAKKEAVKAANVPPSAASGKPPAVKAAAPKAPGDKSATTSTDGLSKNQRKKLAKKAKAEAGAKQPAGNGAVDAGDKKGKENKRSAEEENKDEKKSKKEPSSRNVLPSGLVVEDKKRGNGASAQPGKKVSMRYIGRLQNGKVFDSNIKGKPLAFTLGRGEVIKGWDEGIKGLEIGGERRLTIPPHLAYGKRGTDGIPGNSTLVFDVKLLGVK